MCSNVYASAGVILIVTFNILRIDMLFHCVLGLWAKNTNKSCYLPGMKSASPSLSSRSQLVKLSVSNYKKEGLETYILPCSLSGPSHIYGHPLNISC